jgi:hypothetical protein
VRFPKKQPIDHTGQPIGRFRVPGPVSLKVSG